ncbi:MAG: NADH-quinone oxidoreductase subunit NuoH [Enterobacteriaceae bacterium]
MIFLENFLNLFFKIFVVFFSVIIISSYISLFERKLLAYFQNRHGPNEVGWHGILQVFADFIKVAFKENWTPRFSYKFAFNLAPVLGFIIPLLGFIFIPFDSNNFILSTNLDLLFFLVFSVLNVYSIVLAGWSSNNNYSLLGVIRSILIFISYEVFIGLSLMGIIIQCSTFNILKIIEFQKRTWNVFPQFLSFVNFLIASIASCHRHPFDLPEAEQEISDGYRIEYSGLKFSLFFIGEYINILLHSIMISILFFGGWNGPFFSSFIFFILKTFIFIFCFILIRASLPRPKYIQILKLGWIICLPLSLFNIILNMLAKLYFL